MTLISTAYDFYTKSSSEKEDKEKCTLRKQILVSFSLIKNVKNLFAGENRFSSIDTIRLLVIIWIFVAHSYLMVVNPHTGLPGLKRSNVGIPSQLLTDKSFFWVRSPFAFDTLFIIRYLYIIVSDLIAALIE